MAGRMSCPVSTPWSRCQWLILFEEGLEGAVGCRVARGVVVPAPDDVRPGAGEDADGVRVVVSAGDGFAVEVGGPGVGVAGVAGEVAQGVAQLLVGSPAERDGLDLARLPGGGRDVGEAGVGVGGGEPGAGVADLGEHPCGADGARAGQGREHRRVGVDGELLADAGGQGLDLGAESAQEGDVGAGDSAVDGGVLAGRATGRGHEPGVQGGGIATAAVAHAAQPGAQALGESQSARSWVANRSRKVRVIAESVSAKSVAAAGNTICRWARSWLATATRRVTRSLRARTVERSAVVWSLSLARGRSRRMSVRTTSART